MQHSIIEFKARSADHQQIREILKNKNARYVGTDHQVDTYFFVPTGRLKLREGNIENSLIFYSRPDQAGPKLSDVTMSAVPPGSDLRAVLSKALGVLVTVDKHREIYFVDNVKIHLDRVEGLGTFIEVEAIGTEEDLPRLKGQCDSFRKEFGVSDSQLMQGSYSDMLLER
ncbi:MAG TPA: class IV adenylate cyclase [Terriglobales bacterium]|nr:class IV adenylate cyclase [Terriglobales bacterium]